MTILKQKSIVKQCLSKNKKVKKEKNNQLRKIEKSIKQLHKNMKISHIIS